MKLAWAFRFGQTQHQEIDWELCETLLRADWFPPESDAAFRQTARDLIECAMQMDSADLDW